MQHAEAVQASHNPRKFPVDFRKTDISEYNEAQELAFKADVLNNPTLPIKVKLVQYMAIFEPDPELSKKRKEKDPDVAAAAGGSTEVDL